MQLLSVIHGNLSKVLAQPSLENIVPDERLEKFIDPDVSLNDLTTTYIHELIGTFPWGEITVALSDLLSLTRTIRRAAAKSSGSSSRHVRDDDEYFRGLCRVFARYQLQYARSTMTDLIGDSIYERRKRLLYRMGHEERIRPQSRSTAYTSNPSNKTSAMKPRQALDSSESRRADIVRPPQSTQISKPMRSVLRAPRQTRTVITKPGGFIPGDQNRMPYPDRPVDSVCDYCLEPLKVALSDHEWHTHIENDLQIFLCLAEQCSSSIPFFARKDFWLKHMEAHFADWPQKIQLTTWFCDIAHEQINFNNVLEFRVHLESVHHELPEHRKDAYARRKRAVGIRAAGICPICERAVSSTPEQPCGYEEMVQHIVQHLRTMAMLSLPTTAREIEARLLLLEPQNGTSASPPDGSDDSQQSLSINDSEWTEWTIEGGFTLADARLAVTGEGFESNMEADQATQDQLREVVVQKVESQHRQDDVLLNYAANQVAAISDRTETFVPPRKQQEAEAESQDTGAAHSNAPLSPPPRPVQTSNSGFDYFESESNPFERSFSNPANPPGRTQLPDIRSSTSGLWRGRPESAIMPSRPRGEERILPSRPPFNGVPQDKETRAALWSIWFTVDKNRADFISAAELSQALSIGGHATFSEQTTKMLIRMFDTERSGTINFEDFCGIDRSIVAWEKLFNRVRGPSGKVSLGALESALLAFGFRLSLEVVRLLFDTCTGIGNGTDGGLVTSYAVLAQNFAPGTTDTDIQDMMAKSFSGEIIEHNLIIDGAASVSVEMTFKHENHAKTVVATIHHRRESHGRVISACQVISFEAFVQACARLKQMTDVFKKHDDDRDGYITLSFEGFLTDMNRLLLYVED